MLIVPLLYSSLSRAPDTAVMSVTTDTSVENTPPTLILVEALTRGDSLEIRMFTLEASTRPPGIAFNT